VHRAGIVGNEQVEAGQDTGEIRQIEVGPDDR